MVMKYCLCHKESECQANFSVAPNLESIGLYLTDLKMSAGFLVAQLRIYYVLGLVFQCSS